MGAQVWSVHANNINCTFRSVASPVQLTITDGYTHSKGIGTKMRTCDKQTCSDEPGEHKFVDCPTDLSSSEVNQVFVDNDLVYIQFLNEDTGTSENLYPAMPPIKDRNVSLPLKNYTQDCTFRTPQQPVVINVHNTIKTLAGIKIRTCDEDDCGDTIHKYVDCPMHIPFGTSSVKVDNDLHFIVFYNEDLKTEQEYWPHTIPITSTDIGLPLP